MAPKGQLLTQAPQLMHFSGSMVRDMERLQTLKDGSVEQAESLTRAGRKLASLIGDNLSTESTKTTIELNLAVLKITHEVTRAKGDKR